MTGTHRASKRSYRLTITILASVALVAGVVVLATRGDAGSSSVGVGPPPASGESLEPSAGGSPTPGESPSKAKPEPKKEVIVIHAAGDTNLDPSYIPTFKTQGWDYAWSGLNGLFQRDDLTIINLECAVSNKGSAVPKEFNFRGDPRGLPAMRRAGVEIASLANNHAYDFGPEAIVDTVRNVRDAGITPIGAGANAEEAEAPAILDIKGWRIAVVPWDYVVDPWPTAVATADHPGTAFGHDFNRVVKAVKKVDRKVDLTIVQTHWGVELETRPNPAQIPLGHELIDAGADIIFGGHSHRIQPLEIYKGKPIFWSLGNFVWPNFSAAGAQSGVAEVTVKPNGTIKAKLLDAYITAPGHPVLR